MSEKRNELLEEIDKWQDLIADNEEFLELAFFKVFVKFENLLTGSIVSYAIGEVVSDDKMKRRLEFTDIAHFKNTTRLDYVDTSNSTKRLVQQLFVEENYFSTFFNSTDNEFFEKMKYLRNYIAHESQESRAKYISNTLNNEEYIFPNQFLIKRFGRKDPTSNYTKFINLVVKYSEIFDYDTSTAS